MRLMDGRAAALSAIDVRLPGEDRLYRCRADLQAGDEAIGDGESGAGGDDVYGRCRVRRYSASAALPGRAQARSYGAGRVSDELAGTQPQ